MLVCVWTHGSLYCPLTGPMTVGYEARVYTATESQGEVELSISVTEPPTGGALRPFTLTMNMEDGTARMLKNNIFHVYTLYLFRKK